MQIVINGSKSDPNRCRNLMISMSPQRKLRMVKKDSDGKMEAKPKFEPIDYEEELDFSLQTPTEKAAPPNREAPPAAAEAKAVKIAQERAEDDAEVANSPEESKGGEDVEHKVTVMVHRGHDKADPAPPPETLPQEPASSDKVDASSSNAPAAAERKNSLVTVIKLGPDAGQQQTTAERKKSIDRDVKSIRLCESWAINHSFNRLIGYKTSVYSN